MSTREPGGGRVPVPVEGDLADDGEVGDAGEGREAPGEGPIELVVPALLDGVRVDRAVSLLTGVSRADAARLIASGRVAIGGQPVTVRRTVLAAGQDLRVERPGERYGPAAEPAVAVDVVYEDDQVLVVDKPAGLVVHPGAGHRSGTLVNGLLARFPDLRHLADSDCCDADRPGIVHRLDRGTSGLLAVARTEVAYRSLVAQLTERAVDRRYLALVGGHVSEDRGAVEAPIGRSSRSPVRMAVSAQGRPARTDYAVLHRYDDPIPSTLVALRLRTGRTHQIRVHLAAIGHPIVGDELYGGTVGVLDRGRLFLHAELLGFEHPGDGTWRTWRSELPSDLRVVLPDLPRRQP